jgi:hypothetical protein
MRKSLPERIQASEAPMAGIDAPESMGERCQLSVDRMLLHADINNNSGHLLSLSFM